MSISFGPPVTVNHIGETIPAEASLAVVIKTSKTNKGALDEAIKELSGCIYKENNLRESITINSKEWILYKNESLCGLGNERDIAFVSNKGNFYEIVVQFGEVDTDQILSTVEFLE